MLILIQDFEQIKQMSKVRKSYLSFCFGQKYPEDRMLRDRMFGSMMVSSASGVFRIRPGKKTFVFFLDSSDQQFGN